MPTVEDKFLTLRVEDTRCPERIHGLAPSARTIYVLRERFTCVHWQTVRDLFFQVDGAFIVTIPAAGRKHFTLRPKAVIGRLTKAGVW
jgi:hypothetical protein